jgi:hypothetical protein
MEPSWAGLAAGQQQRIATDAHVIVDYWIKPAAVQEGSITYQMQMQCFQTGW